MIHSTPKIDTISITQDSQITGKGDSYRYTLLKYGEWGFEPRASYPT